MWWFTLALAVNIFLLLTELTPMACILNFYKALFPTNEGKGKVFTPQI